MKDHTCVLFLSSVSRALGVGGGEKMWHTKVLSGLFLTLVHLACQGNEAAAGGRLSQLVPLLTKSCVLPQSWTGSWFHGGFPHPLNITAKVIANKGTCVTNAGSRYIVAEQ